MAAPLWDRPKPLRLSSERLALVSARLPFPARPEPSLDGSLILTRPNEISSLELALAVVEVLVKEHGAVVTESDFASDRRTFRLQLSVERAQ